jgi:hypothetical protein
VRDALNVFPGVDPAGFAKAPLQILNRRSRSNDPWLSAAGPG